MSLTALSPEGTHVFARDVEKKDGPYKCTYCKEDVILKKGIVKIHHFAHYPDSTCEYGTGETELHLKTKLEIYDTLRNNHIDAEIESTRFQGIRPDILIDFPSNTQIAVEVQRSPQTYDQIIRRISNYTETRVPHLWILFYPHNSGPEHGDGINIPYQHRFFHGLYFGQIPYYQDKAILGFYKFEGDGHYVKVWHEDEYGYEGKLNDDGEEVYWKWYKRSKIVKLIDYQDLLDWQNWHAIWRNEWNHIPRALIWIPKRRAHDTNSS